MPEQEVSYEKICFRFSQVPWHDSKLTDLYLLRDDETKKCDLRLGLDLNVAFSKERIERSKSLAVFKECRILQVDLDLLGVLICGGDIASGVCYEDAVDFERRRRNKAQQFDFPQRYNPLEKCLAFLIEMINPGGEIVVLAKDFELVGEATRTIGREEG